MGIFALPKSDQLFVAGLDCPPSPANLGIRGAIPPARMLKPYLASDNAGMKGLLAIELGPFVDPTTVRPLRQPLGWPAGGVA